MSARQPGIESRRQPPVIAGRVPPNDLDAEAAVLSTLLLKPQALDEVSTALRTEHFYSDANGRIYAAMVALASESKPIDAVQVAGWLRDREQLAGVGGSSYIGQIVDATPAVANVADHARRVVEKARVRQVIAEAQAIVAEGYGDHGEDLEWIEQAEQRMAKVAEGSESKPLVTIGDSLRRYWQAYQDELDQKTPPAGGRFGLRDLDDLLGPLRQKRLTVVGGYPGDGKTSLGLQAAVATVFERRVDPSAALIISAEMGDEELAMRALFGEARVDSSKARPHRHGAMTNQEWASLNEAGSALSTVPLWIDDRAEVTVADLAPTVRRHKARAARSGCTLRLVVVDYLQLIDGRPGLGKGANRENEVAAVAKGLKRLAKACEVHVSALAQLNDDANKRARSDGKPSSRDYRESKAIWANADNSILIYNPDARERAKQPHGTSSPAAATPDGAELIVDKHRGGRTGTIEVLFFPHLTRFESKDNYHQ